MMFKLPVLVLKDKGRKAWEFNGKTGVARRIVCQDLETRDVFSMKVPADLDWGKAEGKQVSLNMETKILGDFSMLLTCVDYALK